EGLIGFFVNTLVLRTRLSGDPGFRELLVRVREAALAAYAHQDLPFEKLVAELAPERDLVHTPLFQVMLALQNPPPARLDVPGLEIEALETPGTAARFDLALALRDAPQEDTLAGTLEYSADLFDAATVDRLAGHRGPCSRPRPPIPAAGSPSCRS
ncbi:MAG TPA: condensation domain-containing protein, partial [Thermoanaerobaculia bacterium]|nr:condensation domain-containing protein [Thermoanaerobaculia bacterium]